MASKFTADDERFMTRALSLAARGRGYVEPNPMVGCVLVRKGQVIAEGYHRRFGGPHAEVNALRAAARSDARVQGATAYVTLEPCCHHGKTPPCTEALIAAGVKRVIVAMRDPFAEVSGKGIRQLRSAGIEVRVGLCEAESVGLNAPYLKLQRCGRPWVTLKWAQGIDGKIATRTGDSRWISCQRSRRLAHQLRGRCDAVIVGVQTVLADDPVLTCRHARARRAATRVVIDPSLRTPISAKLVKTANETATMIVTDRQGLGGRAAAKLLRYGVELLGVHKTKQGLRLGQMLDQLGKRGMSNVMVEGGGRTLGSFYDAGFADEALIFVSRRLIGGQEAPSALSGKGPAMMNQLRDPVWTKVKRCDQDDVYQLGLTDPATL